MSVERLWLVRNPAGDITHYVWGYDVGLEDGPLSAIAEPILPKHCIAASTPAIVLLRRFAEEPQGSRWRLVLHGTTLAGFLSPGELCRPELLICVLALLLGVEQRCAEAVTWEPGHSAVALNKLSERRLATDSTFTVRTVITAGTSDRRSGSIFGPAPLAARLVTTDHIHGSSTFHTNRSSQLDPWPSQRPQDSDSHRERILARDPQFGDMQSAHRGSMHCRLGDS
jgi:hypothetical protein